MSRERFDWGPHEISGFVDRGSAIEEAAGLHAKGYVANIRPLIYGDELSEPAPAVSVEGEPGKEADVEGAPMDFSAAERLRDADEWTGYKWPQVEVRWEDGDWYARWKFSPFAMADGPTRELAFAALMELTPTLVMTLADLPHADVRDTATVAQAIALALEKRVEALEALTNSGPPTPPTHSAVEGEQPS